MDQGAIGSVAQRNESGSFLKSGSRVRISPGPPIRRPSSNAESASVLTMKMRVEVPRAAPILCVRVKLNGLSVGVRSRRLWVRSPSRAPVL
jgi:hypothetical protein